MMSHNFSLKSILFLILVLGLSTGHQILAEYMAG